MYIPPLRERIGDMNVLVTYFISRLNSKYQTVKTISTPALHILMTYPWPGNVRELEHVIERLYVTTEEMRIERENVEEILSDGMPVEPSYASIDSVIVGGASLKEARREFETRLVKEAYELTRSTYKAASLLKVDQSTVVRILKKAKKN
jgi:transcriptional regulator with PAS, ATPase and Fis domain